MPTSVKTVELPSGLTFDLILVEGGTFIMGDDESDPKYEKPAHQVKVLSFYMSKYLVTQWFWKDIIGQNPANFSGDNRPVENVSWEDVHQFLDKLNEKTKEKFRLPTEAEWEYAARGGRYSQGYMYAGSDKLKQVGWFDENSNSETHEVGLLLPNELGLYDMSGNVWEWCEDDDHDDYIGAPEDGTAWIDRPERGASRVLRGGGCFSGAAGCRCAIRNADGPDDRSVSIGFRLVLPFESAG
jgi:formylglycine-generating enzyme required for sulfatase activity